jgi:predicted nucleic acid-binding protein
VRSDLADRFRERLLAIDGTVAATWRKLAGEAEARGEPLPVIDGLIAATGLAHDLTIATHNTVDFERCAGQAIYAASSRNSTFTASNGKTMPPRVTPAHTLR